MKATPIITNVYVWDNQMVMVFDQYGKQMPDYQGPKEEVWHRVCQDAPATARFNGGVWRAREVYDIERPTS